MSGAAGMFPTMEASGVRQQAALQLGQARQARSAPTYMRYCGRIASMRGGRNEPLRAGVNGGRPGASRRALVFQASCFQAICPRHARTDMQDNRDGMGMRPPWPGRTRCYPGFAVGENGVVGVNVQFHLGPDSHGRSLCYYQSNITGSQMDRQFNAMPGACACCFLS
jgi:hypothetical protein